ncbi:MDMPI N domain containing protein, partial [Streptomyces sp. SID9944]|nr:MDMPI N domain containing protein [Streptomyces sp. SID9944]
VGLLHPPESLDLDPGLRTRVLEGCLERRPARIPVPAWAAPYDAETARLDALLQDIRDSEWHAPVRLRWFEGESAASRRTTVAGVIAHLMSVDGLVAVALGLADPLADTPA